MARGKPQYIRVAKPMGYVDLENNEFDNFLKLKRKGGIFDRLSKCAKKKKAVRFSSKEAEKKFMKDCMSKSGKADTKKQKSKLQDWKKKMEEARAKLQARQKKIQEEIKSPANPSGENGNVVNEGGVNTTPTPSVQTPDTTIKANPNKKIYLYGAIGIIVLVLALKFIKK